MVAAPLNVSLMITANASGVAAAVGETRSELEAVGTSARDTQGALDQLDAANDAAAVSAKRAGDAARGQAAAERDLAAAVASFAGIRTDSGGNEYARRAADIEAYGNSLDQLRARYNPVFAASKSYERELGELSRAQRLGAITAGEHAGALELLNARYAAAGQASAQYANQAGMARMQIANLGYQIQDIGTMMAMGQNPFMLLAQQLPQVTMHGGQLTGVMGALKGQVAALFSPLGLLTTGFVLAGSAAISYFTDAGDEADIAADALDEQASLIKTVADQWGAAVPELKAYADELQRTKDLSDLAQATIAKITESFDEARASIPNIREEMSAALQTIIDLGASDAEIFAIRDAFKEYNLSVKDVEKALKDGSDSTDEFSRFSKALASLLANESVQSSDALTNAIYRLRDAYSAAADEGSRAAGSRSLLEDRGGVPINELGRGDPRDFEDDEYYRDRYLPDPERPARKTRSRQPRQTDAERAGERYDDIIANVEASIAAQRLEAEVYGMTEIAAERLRQQQILLNQARSADIALTPEQIEKLKELGTTLADVTAETERQGEALNARKAMWGDVVGGIRDAARDGKIELEELADIGLRVMDKLIDKMETDLVNALSGIGGGQTQGGGLLGNLFGSLFGGGGNQLAKAFAGGVGLYDAGGATGTDGPDSEIDGYVHKNEFVFSAPATRRLGTGFLNSLHQAGKRGYALGGLVGDGGGFVGYPAPKSEITIINQTAASVTAEETADERGGRQTKFVIADTVGAGLSEKGGGAQKAMKNSFGLRTRGILR